MSSGSPFELFDRERLGWLAIAAERGIHVGSEDIIRLIEANPDAISDPLLREFTLKALHGDLK